MSESELPMQWTNSDLEVEKTQVSSVHKSHSSGNCNISTVGSTGLTLRETQSFTGALEELRIDVNAPRKQHLRRHNNRSDSSSNSLVNNHLTCPGPDCRATGEFRTREQDTMKLYVTGPEILNYQGSRYSADDIAPIWKKDCRMWLWKAVRNARKRRRQLSVYN